MDNERQETRPPDQYTAHQHHWLRSARAGDRPSSDDVSPCEWLRGWWHVRGEVTPVHPAEMWRRGWHYYKPVEWPPGLDDEPAPLEPLPTPSPTAQRVVEAAVAEREAWHASACPNRAPGTLNEYWAARDALHAATDAHLATVAPPNPLAVALEKIRGVACLTKEEGQALERAIAGGKG